MNYVMRCLDVCPFTKRGESREREGGRSESEEGGRSELEEGRRKK